METKERVGLYQRSWGNPRSTISISGNRAFVPLRGSLADIRSLPSIPRKKQAMYTGAKRKAMTVSAIVALAAMVVIVSSIALAPSANEAASPPSIPAKIQAPRPVLYAVGYTFDEFGAKLGGCAINITDKRTGESNNTTASSTVAGPGFGSYMVDINNGLPSGVLALDLINVTAFKGALRGTNETRLPSSIDFVLFVWLNVTLTTGVPIPEFGSLLAPMVGMLGIMAGVSLVAGKKRNQ